MSGQTVVVIGPNTEKARRLTDTLLENKVRVCTLSGAWKEAKNVLIAKALRRLIEEGYIQRKLGINQAIPPALRLRVASLLRDELTRMARESWFQVEAHYTPTGTRVGEVRKAYAQFALNPATRNRIPQYKYIPSDIDIALILYSGDSHLPLLTNDAELYNFAPELKQLGFCEKIRAFPMVRFS